MEDKKIERWVGSSGRELAYPHWFTNKCTHRGCPKCYGETLVRTWPPSNSMFCGGGDKREYSAADRRVCLKCEAEFDILTHKESTFADGIPETWKMEENLSRWEPLKDRDGRLFTAHADWYEDSAKATLVREGEVAIEDLYVTPEEQAQYDNWPKNALMNKECQLEDWATEPVSVNVWDDGVRLWPLSTNHLHPAHLVICGLRELGIQKTLKARFYKASGPGTDTIEGVREALLQHMYI
jgi:hypothetical protein